MKKYQKKRNEDIKNDPEKKARRNKNAADWRKKHKDKKNKITIDDNEVSPTNKYLQ